MSFVRTIITVEVLGNVPFTGDLEDLNEAVTSGGFSGAILGVAHTVVDGPTMAVLLESQGSEPEFLGAGSAEEGEE